MLKFHHGNWGACLIGSRRIHRDLRFLCPVFHNTALRLKNIINTAGTGKGLCHRNNQIGKLDKLNENLGHIIHQGYQLSLRYDAFVYLS